MEDIQLSNAWLINGDCLEAMKEIPANSVDLVLTDPPYGTTACKWDNVIPLDIMWERLNKIAKDRSPIVLFSSQPFTTSLNYSNLKDYRYEWLWIKNNSTGFQLANKRPLKKHETISVFSKKQPAYFPQGLKEFNKVNRRGSSGENWTVPGEKKYLQKYTNYPTQLLNYAYDSNKMHPTQKPVALMEYLIKTYTNEGDTVLDFTMGSGTTGVACKNLNRKFIGIELDEKYFEIAKDRITNA